jgi:hypothetical protein
MVAMNIHTMFKLGSHIQSAFYSVEFFRSWLGSDTHAPLLLYELLRLRLCWAIFYGSRRVFWRVVLAPGSAGPFYAFEAMSFFSCESCL